MYFFVIKKAALERKMACDRIQTKGLLLLLRGKIVKGGRGGGDQPPGTGAVGERRRGM